VTVEESAISAIEEYRKRAEECAELAERSHAQEKAILLRIAQAWLMLAIDEAHMSDNVAGKTAPGRGKIQ
jgi:hypothetical protein